MNLSQLGHVEAKEFNFIDEYTNLPTDIYVTVYPMKSKVGKKAENDMRHRIIELMQDENNIIEVDGQKSLTENLVKLESMRRVADCVVGWRGVQDGKGKQIDFSRDECVNQFLQCEEFVNAVFAFSNNLGNFTA